jgi:hypothetical protein
MYDLHTLGWSNFQKLCLTIVREILGQTVESFLDSNDGGRDGAFAGTWKTAAGEALSGRFVIQCKFTARLNHALRLTDLKEEVAKVKRLVGPRWTSENRQFVDGSKPAISPVAETSEFYFVASSGRKSVWTLVRQLRGPHLSTCA